MCLKEVDNNLNGLSSGHFTTYSILLNLFSLVNLFALRILTVDVCCFPIPRVVLKEGSVFHVYSYSWDGAYFSSNVMSSFPRGEEDGTDSGCLSSTA